MANPNLNGRQFKEFTHDPHGPGREGGHSAPITNSLLGWHIQGTTPDLGRRQATAYEGIRQDLIEAVRGSRPAGPATDYDLPGPGYHPRDPKWLN